MTQGARAWVKTGFRFLQLVGVDGQVAAASIKRGPRYIRDYRDFRRLCRRDGLDSPPLSLSWPILRDYGCDAGTSSGAYFHADMWAARQVFEAAPARHVDVGSRLDGFISHLLCFRSVEVIDVRPITSTVRGLTFVRSDGTTLSEIPSRSVPSLSSLHAVEHFGLGRYGDTLNPHGHLDGMRSLQRILAEDGDLYFAVPVGRPRIEYNAHRILDAALIPEVFDELVLTAFAGVLDNGDLVEGIEPKDLRDQKYGCGLYHFRRAPSPDPSPDLSR